MICRKTQTTQPSKQNEPCVLSQLYFLYPHSYQICSHLQSKTPLNLYPSYPLIDFNSTSTCLVLFYTWRLGNCIHCTFIFMFSLLFKSLCIIILRKELLIQVCMLHIDPCPCCQSDILCTGRTCENKQKQSCWMEIMGIKKWYMLMPMWELVGVTICQCHLTLVSQISRQRTVAPLWELVEYVSSEEKT